MMAARIVSCFIAFSALACAYAWSQSSTPVKQDLSNMATRDEVNDALAQLQAAIPKPATSVPPTEMTGGSVGSAGTYRPADARQPRITRSKTLTLASDGTATFDWTSQGALTGPVQLAITPVFSGVGVPKCWSTSASTTSASVKCVIEASSLINVAGIQVVQVTNSAPSGLTVTVIALPSS